MRKFSFVIVIILFTAFTNVTVKSFDKPSETAGMLTAYSKDGKTLGVSPLKHTKVNADISGFLARVTVNQEFVNNFSQPIEAIYTFPLSENSAVDRMTMKIGSRLIRGKIKNREEARKIYEQAKIDGKTASLLNQERPNVFTQSIANILPNEKIIIEISYVENLKYEDGSYEFVFPMVVGERYSPASTNTKEAAKVSPPIAKNRAGYDISIEVNLDAGIPVENVSSKLHNVDTKNLSSNSAKITLRNENTIPNKDFILKYDVTGKQIEDAILTHRDKRGGFFAMMLSPPEDFRVDDVSPKEIVFVLDTSGSMSGFPIEKAKEAMKMSLDGLYPNDTFNLITFAGDTHILFEKPVYATQENIEKAREFLESRSGGGGTEMMNAIKAALKPSGSREHIRIVNFMTDGLIGNESAIIAEIQNNPDARVFAFGIGNSVNRFLLSKMAEEGRGEVSFVTLKGNGSEAAKKFHERIRNPLLTDISVDWNGLPVSDVYPKRNPDLFDAKPVVIKGRFTRAASGIVKLKGKVGGQVYEREINVTFPEREEANDVLAALWARKRIDELTSKSRAADETEKKSLNKTIADLGIEYGLLTDFTSFVAVEEVIKTQGGKPVKIEVPVDRASGTYGDDSPFRRLEIRNSLQTPPAVQYSSRGLGSGSGSGSGNGRGSTNLSTNAAVPPPPAPPKPKGPSIPLKILSKPSPEMTESARQSNIQGVIRLRVVFLANGKIGGISVVKGLPHGLTEKAIEAARKIRFKPPMKNGVPYSVRKTVVYNYQNGFLSRSSSKLTFPKPESVSPNIKQKLHFWVFDLINTDSKNDVNRNKYVKNNKANLRIEFTRKSAETMKTLKDLGFVIKEENETNITVGEIAIEKIIELVELNEVKFILPAIR